MEKNSDQTDRRVAKVLIVDDVPANIDLLRQILNPKGHDILVATNGEVALKIAQKEHPDLILLDILMPGLDGLEVCRRLKTDPSTEDIPIIFITAKDETESVVEGFRVGGVDYIVKRFADDEALAQEVLVRTETHLQINQLVKTLSEKNQALTATNHKLQQEIVKRKQAEEALQIADDQLSMLSEQEARQRGLAGFVAQSQAMAEILEDIRRLHNNDTTNVLIVGESGTGKERIARAIHSGGPRAKRPFVPVNCSAIPSELAESTFFGHVRGAFTGANTSQKGYFELADNGTLFLDEIGDMPLSLQAKLLRVLDDGSFMSVGGTTEKRVNVRLIYATNVDLQAKIAAGEFREDLYFRLGGYPVVVPPLRERPGDIPLLTAHFLNLFAKEMGIAKPSLSPDALSTLTAYAFPGNVRELKHIIEGALIKSEGREIRPEHLHFIDAHSATPTPRVPSDSTANQTMTLPLNLQEAEDLVIQRALEQSHGNISEAARLLGVTRKRIYRNLEHKRRTKK